jgi:AcrR family transcriptional regulator
VSEMQPKWSRRKEARPLEIVDAAVDVFLENGFAAAKLSDIAKRARVAKGTIYLYFETKEELFRAAARQLISTNLEGLETAQATFDGSIEELIPTLLQRAVSSGGDARLSAALRMVLSESRMFPELARIWHDEVASRMIRLVASAVERAQAKGTVRAGDSNLMAFSIMAPIVMGVLFHELFGTSSPHAPALDKLASQHASMILHGITVDAM